MNVPVLLLSWVCKARRSLGRSLLVDSPTGCYNCNKSSTTGSTLEEQLGVSFHCAAVSFFMLLAAIWHLLFQMEQQKLRVLIISFCSFRFVLFFCSYCFAAFHCCSCWRWLADWLGLSRSTHSSMVEK